MIALKAAGLRGGGGRHGRVPLFVHTDNGMLREGARGHHQTQW
jgi:hypothetical protein